MMRFVTLEELFRRRLVERGLFESQAKGVIELAKKTNQPQMEARRWDEYASEYPEAALAAMWVVIQHVAVQWIDQNAPRHWVIKRGFTSSSLDLPSKPDPETGLQNWPEHAFDSSGRLYRFPRNRLRQMPPWVRWYLEELCPPVAQMLRTCAWCGWIDSTRRKLQLGNVLPLGFFVDSKALDRIFTHGDIVTCERCRVWIIRGGADGR